MKGTKLTAVSISKVKKAKTKPKASNRLSVTVSEEYVRVIIKNELTKLGLRIEREALKKIPNTKKEIKKNVMKIIESNLMLWTTSNMKKENK